MWQQYQKMCTSVNQMKQLTNTAGTKPNTILYCCYRNFDNKQFEKTSKR